MYDEGDSMWQAPGMFQLKKRTKKLFVILTLSGANAFMKCERNLGRHQTENKCTIFRWDCTNSISLQQSICSNIYCQSRFKMSVKVSNNSHCLAPKKYFCSKPPKNAEVGSDELKALHMQIVAPAQFYLTVYIINIVLVHLKNHSNIIDH